MAKLICRGCQVSAICLSWALAGQEAGVWGGLTEEERRRLQALGPTKPSWHPLELSAEGATHR
jgi:WhiB family redox-sensing transcriptional regulator